MLPGSMLGFILKILKILSEFALTNWNQTPALCVYNEAVVFGLIHRTGDLPGE